MFESLFKAVLRILILVIYLKSITQFLIIQIHVGLCGISSWHILPVVLKFKFIAVLTDSAIHNDNNNHGIDSDSRILRQRLTMIHQIEIVICNGKLQIKQTYI